MRRKLIMTVVSLAGLVVLVGAGYLLFAPEDKPFVTYRYRTMCEKPRAFSQAAPRSAKAPRPVFVSDHWPARDDPTKLSAVDRPVWAPTDPATVQLVACVAHVGPGEFVKRCDYKPTGQDLSGRPATGKHFPFSITLYKGRYRVTVYEARSGRPVGTVEVQGEEFREPDANGVVGDPCAPTATDWSQGSRKEEGDPTVAQLRTALIPYVLK